MIKLAVTHSRMDSHFSHTWRSICQTGEGRGGRAVAGRCVRTKSRMTRGVKAESRVTSRERQVAAHSSALCEFPASHPAKLRTRVANHGEIHWPIKRDRSKKSRGSNRDSNCFFPSAIRGRRRCSLNTVQQNPHSRC